MRTWRRRTLRRMSLLGAVVVGGVLTALLWPDGDQAYTRGERVEGITDTLGRALPEDHPPVTFTEVTEEAGLVFRHFEATRSGKLPEDMGSGVALGDADGDGWTDVFLANLAGSLDGAASGWGGGGSACRLFRNR
ncbi:MAG: hypothetical protein Q8K72_11540, partial [Acidimicrobiales bacterium]|nr:hypothetical protein [Acidimicrobiales bacterium]